MEKYLPATGQEYNKIKVDGAYKYTKDKLELFEVEGKSHFEIFICVPTEIILNSIFVDWFDQNVIRLQFYYLTAD